MERADYVVLDISGSLNVTYEQNYYYRWTQPGDYQQLGGLDRRQKGGAARMKAVSYNSGTTTRAMQVSQETKVQAWAKCVLLGCTGAVAPCVFTGPGWFVCATLVCVGILIACAMDYAVR